MLNNDELNTLDRLTEAINACLALPGCGRSDHDEMLHHLHAVQNNIMARAAVRAHPSHFWHETRFPIDIPTPVEQPPRWKEQFSAHSDDDHPGWLSYDSHTRAYDADRFMEWIRERLVKDAEFTLTITRWPKDHG